MVLTLKKHVDSRWLRFIKTGEKKYEGRLLKNDWVDVEPGDNIVFFNDDIEVDVVVRERLTFRSFEDAYDQLGERLLPGVKTSEEAADIYRQYFNTLDVERFGVIVIRFDLI